VKTLRIGQTTIGKTNIAQAPESGRGLECDKLSRKAVLEFWNGYPKMLIETAGHHIGKTFNYLEIDSYEAGGQIWSTVLPGEFRKRMGYDITPYLPYMAGRLKIVGDSVATVKFRRDWQEGGARELFGYMARCQALLQQGLPAAEQLPDMAVFKTYHRVSGDTDIIFICNPTPDEVADTLAFDPSGRSVEIWNPYTKAMNAMEGCGRYGLTIEPYGSIFLIFRSGNTTKAVESRFRMEEAVTVESVWTLDFPETGTVKLDSLMSWTELEDGGMKFFSGTATYRTSVNIDSKSLKNKAGRVMLSLGKVKDMARVRVNGHEVALMWKSPFICNISEYVRKGNNEIEIDVTNLWPNRMIGDEHEPDDLEWSEPEVYGFAPGSPEIGRFLLNNPEWLRLGLPRPSKGRKTVGCFKYFRADSPLLPSGIFGPVELIFEKQLIQK